MLAIINTYGWDAPQTGNSSVASNTRTRTFNFMCAVHSLATCAAGGTPVAVNPVDSGTSVKNASFNCIKLLSNTEAGGWTPGVSNNITAATVYSASAGSQRVDLYKDSGKSSNPYYRWTMGTDTYPFNGSFDSYPQLQMWCGHNNSSYNPAVNAWNADNNYYQPDYGVNLNARWSSSWTNNPYQRPFDASTGYQTHVAITANYIILSQANQMWYYGIRQQAGWELGRTDNPAWATFGFCGDNGSANHVNSSSQHTDWAYAWMASIDQSGNQNSASRRGQARWYETGMNSLTGQNYNDTTQRQFNMSGGLRPLFPMGYPSNNSGQGWATESPVTDPVTGLTVPPAYPIVFNYGSNSDGCSGQVPGIYKGMSHNSTGLNFYVTASEYVIDGQSYVPVRTANPSYPELFFLRKA
jgi:hypothetical protein